MIIDGVSCKTFAELEARLLSYRTAHQQLALIQGRAAPMELGAVGSSSSVQVAAAPEETNSDAQLEAKIAAIVQAQSKGKGGGSYTAGYARPGAQQKGKGKKGKGKGGKPSAAQVGWRRQQSKPMSQVMCPELVRTGRCTFEERTGTACRFAHSSNMPKSLSGLEGLITTDLPLAYDKDSGCFTCGEVSPQQLDAIQASIESAYKELVNEFEEAGNKSEEGFHWQP